MNDFFNFAATVTRDHARETVQIAARRAVRASSSGTANFANADDADSFINWIYDNYHPGGYGTSARVRIVESGVAVDWYVGSAD